MCDTCKLVHNTWTLDEDPLIRHALDSSNCDFLIKFMDQQLLNDIQRTKNQSSIQEGMTSTIGPENEELSDEGNNNESFFIRIKIFFRLYHSL